MKKESMEKEAEAMPPGNLLEHCSSCFERALEELFTEHREFFVHEISLMIRRAGVDPASVKDGGDPWIPVESLSRLRGIVGGRFQNLRKRWIDAGFPFREHRGDKSGDYTLDERGWIELSNWILKQGYEARLAPKEADHLFELRATLP